MSRLYSRFLPIDISEDADRVTDINNDVMVLFQRQAMPYAIYRAIKGVDDDDDGDNDDDIDDDDVKHYAKLVGKNVAQRMLLYRE